MLIQCVVRQAMMHTLLVLLLSAWAVTAIHPDEVQHIVDAEPAILLEVGAGPNADPTSPGVKDPATQAAFRHVPKVSGLPTLSDPDVDFTYKSDLTGAYKATLNGQPTVDRRSQQLADLNTVKRECPRARCPSNARCASPGMTCCRTGNFSFCCPAGSTCLNTKIPTCLKEPVNDTRSCTTEECAPTHHCPFSKVAFCCIGGMTCCPFGSKCSGETPPRCRLMTRVERQQAPQPRPLTVVKGKIIHHPKFGRVLDDTPFPRLPVPVVPLLPPKPKAPAPAPKPKPKPAAPAPAPRKAVKPLHIKIQEPNAHASLFPTPPTQPGTRTRQRSYLRDNKRITITEVQKTTQMADGGLKTVTKRHRVVSEVSAGNTHLWPKVPVAKQLKTAIGRSLGEVVVKPKNF